MLEELLPQVYLSSLKKIETDKGSIYHGMKSSDTGYKDFGEVYFTSVKEGVTKGWRKHLRMTLNLVVVNGEISLFLVDGREGAPKDVKQVNLSRDNYKRLTVPPGVWVAFRGNKPEENLMMNIASIPHDPEESVTQELDTFQIPE